MTRWYKEWNDRNKPSVSFKEVIGYSDQVVCKCGNSEMKVYWGDEAYCGGYCAVECTKCSKTSVLINDYA